MPGTLLDCGEYTGTVPQVGGSWGREQIKARTSAFVEQRATKLERYPLSKVGLRGTPGNGGLFSVTAFCAFPLSVSLLREHNEA